MEILVCIKRVPTVGGKIAVTPGRAAGRHSGVGVLVSLHEVLTLGPEAAVMEAPVALFTVATDSVAKRFRGNPPASGCTCTSPN